MVAWQLVGIAMGVYDMCHRYLKERKQFRVPLASFQINQEKLVYMLGNVQPMLLIGWRLCKLYESGKMTAGQASMGKAWITLRARETVALGRELLGGNGILADFLVAKAFCDLEPIFTYEGTYDINNIITEREVTGLASFKLHPMRKQNCIYARCTHSVSIVPLAYYAHLAAFQARFCMEPEMQDNCSTVNGNGHASVRASMTVGEVGVRPLLTLKENVKRVMFHSYVVDQMVVTDHGCALPS